MSGPEPSATPLPAASTDPTAPEPSEQIEIASSSDTNPAPFVLFGALLFALAAAAGQVLRADPNLIRRFVPGFEGAGGRSGGAPRPAYATAGGPPTGPDAFTTLTGNESLTHADITLDTTVETNTVTDFVDPGEFAQTLDVQPSTGTGGTGGLGGGAQGPLDGLGKGGFGGAEANGFGGDGGLLGDSLSVDQAGSVTDAQLDLDQSSEPQTRLTDYDPRPTTAADAAPKPAAGGGMGGGQGGDALARGVSPSGSEVAGGNGSGGFGSGNVGLSGGNGSLGGSPGSDLLARGGGMPADALANAGGGTAPVDSGLGGVHGQGSPDVLARGLTPGGVDLAGLPTSGRPGDLGLQGGLGGETGAGDLLARGLSPSGGVSATNVAGTIVTPSGSVDAGPIWLAAGALARAGGLELGFEESAADQPTRSQERPTSTFACPSCARPLHFGHRYCGYCGEPLDKTLA